MKNYNDFPLIISLFSVLCREANRRAHSKPGTVPFVSEKKKHVVEEQEWSFLTARFCRVLNVVCFLLDNSPASEFYMLTFRNTLSHLHRQVDVWRILHTSTCLWRWNRQECSEMEFRRQGITQKKAYRSEVILLLLYYGGKIYSLLYSCDCAWWWVISFSRNT